MIKHIILFLGLFLASCGTLPQAHTVPDDRIIDDIFLPYLEEFKSRARAAWGIDVMPKGIFIMTFTDIHDGATVGRCKLIGDFYRAVIIDQTAWEESNEAGRLFLVVHELGHCLLNQGHTKSGFMTPHIQHFYDEELYWEKLFNPEMHLIEHDECTSHE